MQQQNNSGKVYSKSLKNIIAMKYIRGTHEDNPFQQLRTERHHEQVQKKDNLRESINQLLQNKRKYDHQIDSIVKQLAQKEKLEVELPPFKRKNNYQNYRILSSRQQQPQYNEEQQQDSQWRKDHLPQLQKQKRTRTEPKEYQLSKQRENIYSIVKHYRIKSLKNIQLHLNMNQLKKWHDHNRKTVEKRQLESYKLRKPAFHRMLIS